ncbi:MAG: DHHA1 domain-containing protein [Candidatus Korarchaeum sp.]|jgi:hypothetical protein|nr:DHHA1 domain-containing protein [Candidatus Korarchaeum sp.]
MLEDILKEERLSICSHGEDLDGLVSASLMMVVRPEGLEIHFSAPYEIKNSESSYDIVLDLPPPRGGARVLIDHHISNSSALDRVAIPILRTDSPSTARIVYELISEWEPGIERYSAAVELTDEIDSGKMDLKSAIFTSAVRKLFKERRKKLINICKDILKYPPNSTESLIELPSIRSEVNLIMREYGNLIDKILGLPGGDSILLRIESYPSYLVPIIQLAANSYKLLGTVTRGSDGLLRLSIRSRTDSPLTALQLAEAFGGGGHEHAAGALIMPSRMPEVIERIRNFMSLEVIDL